MLNVPVAIVVLLMALVVVVGVTADTHLAAAKTDVRRVACGLVSLAAVLWAALLLIDMARARTADDREPRGGSERGR